MFLIRLISSVILTPLVIAIIFLFSKTEFMIFILILSVLALWEWGTICNIEIKKIFFCISIFLFSNIILFFTLDKIFYFFIAILLISFFWWILVFILILYYPKKLFYYQYYSLNLTTGLFQIIPFFYAMFLVRNFNILNINNSWLIFYIVFTVFSFDSGSYIFGKIFGKHKIIKKISPQKTWEGLLGGILLATMFHLMICMLKPIFKNILISLFYLFCILISAFLGDITESMFKRRIGIKDSGNIIPGHGGILDRIDSLISSFPIFTFILLIYDFFEKSYF